MKYLISQIECAVPLTKKQWEALDRYEDSENGYELMRSQLKTAESIDWNGHFGRYFFFKCRNRRSADAILKRFEKALLNPPAA